MFEVVLGVILVGAITCAHTINLILIKKRDRI